MCSRISRSDTKLRARNTMMTGISCFMYGRMEIIRWPIALFFALWNTPRHNNHCESAQIVFFSFWIKSNIGHSMPQVAPCANGRYSLYTAVWGTRLTVIIVRFIVLPHSLWSFYLFLCTVSLLAIQLPYFNKVELSWGVYKWCKQTLSYTISLLSDSYTLVNIYACDRAFQVTSCQQSTLEQSAVRGHLCSHAACFFPAV